MNKIYEEKICEIPVEVVKHFNWSTFNKNSTESAFVFLSLLYRYSFASSGATQKTIAIIARSAIRTKSPPEKVQKLLSALISLAGNQQPTTKWFFAKLQKLLNKEPSAILLFGNGTIYSLKFKRFAQKMRIEKNLQKRKVFFRDLRKIRDFRKMTQVLNEINNLERKLEKIAEKEKLLSEMIDLLKRNPKFIDRNIRLPELFNNIILTERIRCDLTENLEEPYIATDLINRIIKRKGIVTINRKGAEFEVGAIFGNQIPAIYCDISRITPNNEKDAYILKNLCDYQNPLLHEYEIASFYHEIMQKCQSPPRAAELELSNLKEIFSKYFNGMIIAECIRSFKIYLFKISLVFYMMDGSQVEFDLGVGWNEESADAANDAARRVRIKFAEAAALRALRDQIDSKIFELQIPEQFYKLRFETTYTGARYRIYKYHLLREIDW